MKNSTHLTTPASTRYLAALAALLMGLAGCGDDPFAFNWSDRPDTVLVYSLARPELNLPSGFGFRQRVRVRIEAAASTGTWDIAVDTRNNEIVLLPPGALGVVSTARIAVFEGTTLDDMTRAPSDTLVYEARNPVPVRVGTTYVVKTGRSVGSFGRSCVYYAKMEAVDIDVAGGTLTFRHVTNPVCNSVDLIPPK